MSCLFQSTPPVKAATAEAVAQRGKEDISIHAAREGGDVVAASAATASTISIHAAREGGDHFLNVAMKQNLISIHAAREGGDDPIQR